MTRTFDVRQFYVLFASDFKLLNHHIQGISQTTICAYAMHILHIRICASFISRLKLSVNDNDISKYHAHWNFMPIACAIEREHSRCALNEP